MTKLIEETDDWFLYQVGHEGYVPFGEKYVFKRDVTRGDLKGKAGTTKMFHTKTLGDGSPCPIPRKIELRKKYLKS
tara:strand:+ start:704 stop:931 length:228 start_codon:yes stop_codon:yes gene_type:complete